MNENHPKIGKGITPPPIQGEKIKKGSPDKSDEFKRILNKETQSAHTSESSQQKTTLSEIQGPFQPRFTPSSNIDTSRFTLKMTAAFDMFEQYTTFLGDPAKPLKETYALLEQILSETQSLKKELDDGETGSASGNIDEIKTILTQLLTTARVEQVKFDRGDYLI